MILIYDVGMHCHFIAEGYEEDPCVTSIAVWNKSEKSLCVAY